MKRHHRHGIQLHIGVLLLATVTQLSVVGANPLCHPNFQTQYDEQHAISQVIERWMAYWEAGDAAGVASLYTQDAILFAPGAEPLVGREAIEAFIQGALNAGIARNTLVTEELLFHPMSFADNWCPTGEPSAHELGHYYFYVDGLPDPVDDGPYMVRWVKRGGRWLLHRDIMNSATPAQ